MIPGVAWNQLSVRSGSRSPVLAESGDTAPGWVSAEASGLDRQAAARTV